MQTDPSQQKAVPWLRGAGVEGERTLKELEEFGGGGGGMMARFQIRIVVVVSGAFATVKTHRIVHFKYM